jgi:hypothetical protein
MEWSDRITADDIISEVSMMLDDADLQRGLSRGYYMNSVQRSYEDLNLQSFMTILTKDIPLVPGRFTLDMPSDSFNIREMYLHNGVCCQPGNEMAVVHWKRLYNNSQGGAGYTALVKDNQAQDYYYNAGGQGFDIQSTGFTTYFANIENRLIMLSSPSLEFKYLRLVYNSLGGEIGSTIEIPRVVRECITLMTAKRVCKALLARDEKKYRTIYQTIVGDLDDPREGALARAKVFLVRMGTWKRNEFNLNNETSKY